MTLTSVFHTVVPVVACLLSKMHGCKKKIKKKKPNDVLTASSSTVVNKLFLILKVVESLSDVPVLDSSTK